MVQIDFALQLKDQANKFDPKFIQLIIIVIILIMCLATCATAAICCAG